MDTLLFNSRYLFILGVALFSLSVGAQSIKLNHPISGVLDVYTGSNYIQSSPVDGFQASPDGNRVVYWVRDFLTDEHSLHSVASDGSDHAILSQKFVVNIGINKFEISPDSSRVVYYKDTDLYSIPIAGGTAIKLNTTPIPSSAKDDFNISVDSQQVIYLNDSSGSLRLNSVPITGGGSTELSPNSVNPTISFRLSPNGGHIVFWGQALGDTANELYSLSLTGGGETKLISNLSDIGGAGDSVKTITYEFTPDSSRVVFMAQVNNQAEGLYSAPIGGGTFSQVVSLGMLGGSYPFSIKISPDGQHVLYSFGSDNLFGNTYRPDRRELYHVPIGGGVLTELGLGINTRDFEFTPDSSRVVYSSAFDEIPDLEFPDQIFHRFRIYSESLAGSDLITLAGAETSPFFRMTTDGERVIFSFRETGNVTEVFGAPTNGDPSSKLNSFQGDRGEVRAYNVSPDGSRVLYLSDQDVDGVYELYSAPTSRVNGPSSKFVIRASNGKLVIFDL